ncbi:PLxRFG domain-containing protein [Segnochrobactraceae bacterium EtOH-i3]
MINQIEPTTGRFDEHKILIGYRDRGQAERAYRENYTRDWQGMGSIVRLTATQFRDWLKSGDTRKPLALPAPKSTESDDGVRGRNKRGESPAPVGADGVGQPAGAPGDAGRVVLGTGADPGAADARGGADLPGQRPTADAKPALKAGQFREGRVGDMLAAGDRVLTATGRPTGPFPKVDMSTDRRTRNTLKRIEEWLMDNAADEAKARGDEMNERIFRTSRQKPSMADKYAAEAYLFDREFVEPHPAPITKPLVEPGTPANTPPPASWVIRNKETGEVVMETFDRKKVEALNTSKYEAVSAQIHLSGLGKVDQGAEEGVRAQRQKQRAQKAANLRARADELDARAKNLRGVGGDDPALTTPSSHGSAFGRAKERGRSAYLEAGRLSTEAERLRSEAADLDRPARVRGDAERESAAKADALDVAPGDTVDWMGREFEVLKVNAKTVTLKGARENMRAEKSLVRVVRKARAAEESAAENGQFGQIFQQLTAHEKENAGSGATTDTVTFPHADDTASRVIGTGESTTTDSAPQSRDRSNVKGASKAAAIAARQRAVDELNALADRAEREGRTDPPKPWFDYMIEAMGRSGYGVDETRGTGKEFMKGFIEGLQYKPVPPSASHARHAGNTTGNKWASKNRWNDRIPKDVVEYELKRAPGAKSVTRMKLSNDATTLRAVAKRVGALPVDRFFGNITTYDPEAIDFEDFARRRGIDPKGYTEPGLHNSMNHVSRTSHRRMMAELSEKMAINSAALKQARADYDAEVAAGAVRPLTTLERRQRIARGHPDNAATQAARRMLAKHGETWNEDDVAREIDRERDIKFSLTDAAATAVSDVIPEHIKSEIEDLIARLAPHLENKGDVLKHPTEVARLAGYVVVNGVPQFDDVMLKEHGIDPEKVRSGEARIDIGGFAKRVEIPRGRSGAGSEIHLSMAQNVSADVDAQWLRMAARHEVVHALRQMGLFSQSEWKALENAARNLGWTDPDFVEKEIEESIADAFGYWGRAYEEAKNGAAPVADKYLISIFRKISDFFSRLNDIIFGRGDMRLWERIFKAIEEGEIGNRNPESVAEEKSIYGRGNNIRTYYTGEDLPGRLERERLERESQEPKPGTTRGKGPRPKKVRTPPAIKAARLAVDVAEDALFKVRADVRHARVPENFWIMVGGQRFTDRENASAAIAEQLHSEYSLFDLLQKNKYGDFSFAYNRTGKKRDNGKIFITIKYKGIYNSNLINKDSNPEVFLSEIERLSGKVALQDAMAAAEEKLRAANENLAELERAFSEENPGVLFSKAPSGQGIINGFATGPEADAHLRTGALGSTIGRLIDAGRVVIHDDASTLPGAGHPEGAIQGMTTAADGTIHLVAANLTRETAPAVLLHEAFHSGARPLLGDVVWTRTLERVRVAAQAAMDRADASVRGPSDTFWEAALTSATVANTPLPHLSEEIAAYAIEHREQAPAGVREMVDRLIGAVKAWLLRRFGVQAGRVTPAELRALAVAAMKDWDADAGEARVTGGFSTINRIASTFAQAREAVKAFQGKPLKNAATGMEAVVSRNNLDKMLSGKAVSKSATTAAHALAVANVDQLFEKATLGWSKPDTHGDVNINAIHRFFAPIRTHDGRAMLAKLTVKEVRQEDRANPLYTVEAVEFNEANPAREWLIAAAREDGVDVEYPLRGEWAGEIGAYEDAPRTALYGFRVTKAATRAAGDVMNLAQEVENFNRNGEVRYSMRMPSVPSKDQLFERARQALTAAMVGAKGSDKDRGRFSALGLVPTRPLFLELAKDLKSAKTYIDLKMSMDTLRNEWHAVAADTVQGWVKFARKNKAANEELMDIMHESTLAEVDPSKDFESLMTHGDWYQLRNFNPETEKYQALLEKEAEDKARKKVHTDLTKRFAALPAEAKTIFKTVRDHYRKLADATEAQVLANVQEALQKIVKNAERTHEREMQRIVDEGLTGKAREDAIEAADRRLKYARARTARNRAARLRSMRAEFESNRLKGAYFPLARFGHYFVTLRDGAGKVVSFSRFESVRKQEAFIAEMGKSEPSLKVEHGILDAKTNYSGMVDPKFVSEVEAILEGANAPEALRDEVWQAYLQSLPDLSTRKNRIHRKGTAGFEKDAIRAFAHQLFHGSHQLARLTYGLKLQDAIDEMAEQAQKARDPVRAKAVANEIKWRHDFIMNPSQAPWSHWMTSAAFVWTMGANLSSALVNIDQTFTKGIPWIAADKDLKPGVKRTTAAILQAMRDFTVGHGWTEKSARLSSDEKAAMRAGYENGLIDRTQAHDVAGVAETGVAYSARRDRIMRFLSWPMHHTERFNREVTYLASYRLARQKGMGHGDAIKKASDLTWFTHFDNQSTSKPRFMQGDWGRVVFAMKSFQANILYRIFRDLHQAVQGESPEVKREAIGRVAGTFIATLLAAGIKGSIAYGLVMTLASAVMGAVGDDDDPEEALRKWVLEHTGDTVIGRAVGGMMMDGIPGYLTGTSLSGRIGMADLWFRSNDRDLEGSDAFLNIVGNVLGVPFGLAQSIHGGYESIADGQVWRGAEQMSPAALRNAMKSIRYLWEGALNRRGAQIVENVSIADIIKQAVGFTPAQIAEQSRANNFAYNMQTRIRDEKAGLMDALWAARSDPDQRAKVMSDIQSFNARHPGARITPTGVNQSMRGRERYLNNAVGGANIDKGIRPEIEGKLAPSIY